jgi:hypothetical protein
MKRLALILAATLALTGCTAGQAIHSAGTVAAATADTVGTPPPVTYADRTTLDEKGAIGAETTFTLAAKGATLAIRAGLVSEPATVVRIGQVRAKAYAALLKVRAAYRLGNATSYSAAFREFETAIADLNTLF